jgi:hypothetical protein
MSETTETVETHRFFDWLVCERNSGGGESKNKASSPDWNFDCLLEDHGK